jgi:hypothetical protein
MNSFCVSLISYSALQEWHIVKLAVSSPNVWCGAHFYLHTVSSSLLESLNFWSVVSAVRYSARYSGWTCSRWIKLSISCSASCEHPIFPMRYEVPLLAPNKVFARAPRTSADFKTLVPRRDPRGVTNCYGGALEEARENCSSSRLYSVKSVTRLQTRHNSVLVRVLIFDLTVSLSFLPP